MPSLPHPADHPTKPRAKRVRVARNRLGKGVYATRYFAPSEIIGEIEGTVIDDESYGSRYGMDLGDSRCLEPGPPFRFMNHSCSPNCEFRWHDITSAADPKSRRRIFVLAGERIYPGDELTIDYRWPAHMAIPCRCGETNCRRWVVALESLDEVLAAAGQPPAPSSDI